MSELFPFIDMEETEVENESEELELYKEIAWDFENNIPLIKDGDFVILEGNEALKVWIFKTLHVNRYEYMIYTWDYGNELESLFGQGYSKELIQAEAKRYLEECLLVNEYIKSINNIEVNLDDNILSTSFSVTTIYGELEVSI